MKYRLPPVLQKYGIFLAFLAIVVWFSLRSAPFRTPTNALNILRQTSVHGIMAVGMTFVIVTSGIDLSVGSILALAGVICASLEHRGLPVPLTVVATLFVGSLVGLTNGVVITKGKVTPFVVTLGMMSIARGATLLFTDAQPISGFRPQFRYLGTGEILGIPVPVLLFLLTVVVGAVLLKRTRMGRYMIAIGGNRRAAMLSGIPVDRYTAMAYLLCGLTAAASAVVLNGRLNAAEATAGTGYELDVIASVVIGGTSLAGGRGSVWGTLLGALLIGTINNGMNLLGISAHFQLVVKGTLIVLAVLLDRMRVADRNA